MGWIADAQLLTWIAFLPLGTAVLLILSGVLASVLFRAEGLPPVAWQAIGLASSSLVFALAALGLWTGFDPEWTGFQLVEHHAWLPALGINYYVGVDGISLMLVLLTAFLVPLALLACWNEVEHFPRTFIVLMLTLETCLLGVLLSLNLFQFYLFWELSSVSAVFIIGVWGGRNGVAAAVKFMLFAGLGSVFMLLALMVVYRLNFEQGGVLNLDWVSLPGVAGLSILHTEVPTAGETWWRTQPWLFAAFALAFAIKVPLFPLHTWMPDASVEAPTAGTVVLVGLLLKLGAYGFMRFAIPLFPVAADAFVPLFFGLALTGIIYGSLVAMIQRNAKRLVAYASLAHLGFAVLGIFALNSQGLVGGVLQLVNHGLSATALLLIASFLYERRRTYELGDFGGLARPMPVCAALLGIAVLSSIGVPALNGFVAEFMILLGAFATHGRVAAAAAVGGILIAIALLGMYRRVMLGPVDPENRGLIDLDLREKAVIAALVIPMLWIGVYPNPFLRRIEPSVSVLLEHLQQRTPEATDDVRPGEISTDDAAHESDEEAMRVTP